MTSRIASCSCGQLRIQVEGEPRGVGICNCLACQRRTGSVFAALAGFAAPFKVGLRLPQVPLGSIAAGHHDLRERSTMKALLLLLALCSPAAFAATDDAKGPADTAESAQAKQELLWGRMEESVRSIVRETDAVVGVAILDLTDQR